MSVTSPAFCVAGGIYYAQLWALAPSRGSADWHTGCISREI